MTSPEGDARSRLPQILRAARFHETLGRCWSESPDRAGEGRLHPDAPSQLESLWSAALSEHSDQSSWSLFALGLLAEASEPEALAGEVRGFIEERLTELLAFLTRIGSLSDSQQTLQMPGLLYLLGQMSDHHARIAEHCERSLAADSPWRPACARIFDPEALSGSLRRSIVAYLGAQAAGEIPPDRLPMLSSTLACPECQGALEVLQSPEAGLHCGTCAHDFAFAADALDLRPRSSTPEAEFDEALVRRYESMTRPRFVRTMSRDWDRSLTPEVEEHYIARHLSTGDGPVLDVACGAGGWTEMVARQVGAERVLALDLSMPMVQACLDRVPRAIGICGDATRLPIQSGSLAAANCSDALQALPRPSDGLREISRCLRPGAPFTAFTFLEGDAMYRYFQHRVPLHARHLFSEAELRTTLDDVGLEVTDWSQRGLGQFFTARKR